MTRSSPSGSSPPDKPNPSNTNNINIGVRKNAGQAIAQMKDSRATSVGEGTYIENYYSGNQPLTGQSKSKSIPKLLPYLADRSQQEDELAEFFGDIQSTRSRRPIAVIVHGDEFQCHLKFLERLKDRSLPRLLTKFCGLSAENNKVEEKLLYWPSEEVKVKNLSIRLKRELADTVLNDRDASLEEINQHFADYPGTTMVSTTLLTSEWKTNGLKPLEELLKFWRGWPTLNSGQQLIICISVKYQLAKPTRKEKFGWRWLLNLWQRWRAFRRCRYCQKLNLQISEDIKQLETSNFRGYEPLHGIVLPELTGINRSHVEHWVRKEARDFVGEAKLQILLGKVREMYDELGLQSNENEVTMPMDNLANHLIKLLENC